MICLTTNRCAFSWTMTISRRNSRRNCCQNAYSTGITTILSLISSGEEALQSKRDFRNGFCDAYAIPMDMLSEVVADIAHAVKFDDSFSKDDAFFTTDIVGEEVVIKSHKFGDIVAYYRDEVVEWAADDLPPMLYDELWIEKEERRAYYEEEVLPRKLKELEWERSAAMRDFI